MGGSNISITQGFVCAGQTPHRVPPFFYETINNQKSMIITIIIINKMKSDEINGRREIFAVEIRGGLRIMISPKLLQGRIVFALQADILPPRNYFLFFSGWFFHHENFQFKDRSYILSPLSVHQKKRAHTNPLFLSLLLPSNCPDPTPQGDT